MSAQLLAAGSAGPLSAGSPPWPAPICPSAQALESFAFLKTKIHCCSGCKSLEQRAAAVQLAQPPLSQAKERDVRIPAPAQELSHKYRLPEPPGSPQRGQRHHKPQGSSSGRLANSSGEDTEQNNQGRTHPAAHLGQSSTAHGGCCTLLSNAWSLLPQPCPRQVCLAVQGAGAGGGVCDHLCAPKPPTPIRPCPVPQKDSRALGYLLAKCSILE